ncbi:hypothetical protein BpHYR1_023920 [Brachionus plicatilis]|uniref:Uncharacterized protein n=1 Tax=Brachionus plicatilis TaxID=10195 RepID=A0A3M7R5W8_BRAPC|nr:hypothetical protein BpHYR1_023920 [Brachionus plicatilis]
MILSILKQNKNRELQNTFFKNFIVQEKKEEILRVLIEFNFRSIIKLNSEFFQNLMSFWIKYLSFIKIKYRSLKKK